MHRRQAAGNEQGVDLARVGKKPVFFWVFWVFLGFLGFFGFVGVFFTQNREFLEFFSFKNTLRCIQT